MGVSHKPLVDPNIHTSEEIWAISHRGSIFHDGEADDTLDLVLTAGDSLELQFNASNNNNNNNSCGTLLCDYGTGYMVVHGIKSKDGNPVYPILLFPQDTLQASNTVTLRFHPIEHSSSVSFEGLRCREQLSSGYPHLSPSSSTLSQAVVSLLYQLQDREPWRECIGQVPLVVFFTTQLNKQ